MSYEGYCQYICKKGHRFDGIDIWHARDAGVDVRCNICNATWDFINEVDRTNGEDFGYVCEQDWRRFLATPEKVVVCNYGHRHVLEHATYRIPSQQEIDSVRTYIIGRQNNKLWRAYISTNEPLTEQNNHKEEKEGFDFPFAYISIGLIVLSVLLAYLILFLAVAFDDGLRLE